MSPRQKNLILWLVLVLMFVYVYNAQSMHSGPPEKPVPISEFVSSVEQGKIGWVRIEGESVYGLTKDKSLRYASYTKDAEKLREILYAKRVGFRESPSSEGGGMGSGLMMVAMLILPIAFLVMMMRAMRSGSSGAMQFGKSKARLIASSAITVRFPDVAGNDEAKRASADIVAFLKDPKQFTRLGGQMPKGVLLYGGPGNGKTLLARALAGEAGVPFFSISGSDFVEMFVGVGASRIRDLFEQAKKNGPCIVFIDELDAIGKKRASGMMGGNDEREQALNQLLVEMDGFESDSGVILIAATNKPETLDPALTRPGRLSRKIEVTAPDLKGREDGLRIHVRRRRVLVDPQIDYRKIAKAAYGFSGAALENLVNEAALLATRLGKDRVETADFLASQEKALVGGDEKPLMLTPRDKEITTWHESGHAVAGWFSPDCDPIHRVSNIPRGPALGYTMSLPENEHHLYRKSQLLDRITMMLGGRAAETLLLGNDFTSGAGDDLMRATDLAKKMVTQLGMGDDLPPRTYGVHMQGYLGDHSERDYGDDTARMVDEKVSAIITSRFEKAVELLKTHDVRFKAMIAALMDEETLDDERVLAILGPRPTA